MAELNLPTLMESGRQGREQPDLGKAVSQSKSGGSGINSKAEEKTSFILSEVLPVSAREAGKKDSKGGVR